MCVCSQPEASMFRAGGYTELSVKICPVRLLRNLYVRHFIISRHVMISVRVTIRTLPDVFVRRWGPPGPFWNPIRTDLLWQYTTGFAMSPCVWGG